MNEIKEKLNQTGIRILELSRNELYLSLRFLEAALSMLRYEMNLSTKTIGTDGVSILFNPRFLIEEYSADRVFVNRVYMHMVIHNLFRHDFNGGKRNKEYWNVACDIAAESLIDSMGVTALSMTVTDYREYIYRQMKAQMKVLTAEGIYRYLMNTFISDREFDRMCRAFVVDDHRFWEQEDQEHPKDQERQQQRQQEWQQISERMQTNMQTFSKDYGDLAGDMLVRLTLENRERVDYSAFLRRFASYGEEIRTDDDSFDYIFYTYGLDHYKNMPLVEPLEYKDVKKIDEFVIAIDTSQSCPPDTVKAFLEETYGMLCDRESFFKKVNVHILLCDAGISSDVVITCREDFERYIHDFQVTGFGGTDFRPVFDYTEKLIEDGSFHHLKGLIYFTDGYGEFPKKKPPFETAFIFMTEEYSDKNVPPWAIRLIMTPEDFTLQEDFR